MDRNNTNSDKVVRAILSIVPDAKLIWNDNDYDDIQWLDENTQDLPSWETVDAKITELENAEPLKYLRETRNAKLAETDWTQSRDVTLTNDADWQTYRQALRDITDGVSTTDDIDAITWPTKP
jgi:hypothetical protein